MDLASFSFEDRNGIPTIVAAGEIDISNISSLKELFDKALQSDSPAIIASLEGVTYLDSTTFSVLLKAAGLKRLLVVKPASVSVEKLFRIVGLERAAVLFETRDEAAEAALLPEDRDESSYS